MVEYLQHYGLTILQMCADIYFAKLFFKSKRITHIAIVISLVSLPLPIINSLENTVINLLSAIVALLVVAIIVFEKRIFRVFVMALAIFGLNFGCELTTIHIASLLLKDKTGNIVNQHLFDVIYSFISLLLFFAIAWIVKSIMARRQTNNPLIFTANFRVLMLIAMTIILGHYVVLSSQYHQNVLLSGIGLAIFVLLIIVDIAVMLGSERDIKKYELAKNLEAMKLQEEYNIAIIQQLEESQQALTKQAHDFKNHLINIDEMINTYKTQAELNEADIYVNDLVQSIGRLEAENELGIQNTALRAIVRRLKDRCEKIGIELHMNVQYSDFFFMKHQDIGACM